MAQAALNNNAHTQVFIPHIRMLAEGQSDIKQVLTGRVRCQRGINWTLPVTVRFVI